MAPQIHEICSVNIDHLCPTKHFLRRPLLCVINFRDNNDDNNHEYRHCTPFIITDRFVDSQCAFNDNDDLDDCHNDDYDIDDDNQQVCGWPTCQWLRSRLLCHFKHLTELPHGHCQVWGILCLFSICLYSKFCILKTHLTNVRSKWSFTNISTGQTSCTIAFLDFFDYPASAQNTVAGSKHPITSWQKMFLLSLS